MKMRTIIVALGISIPLITTTGVAAAETEFSASIFLPTGHPVTEVGYIDLLEKLEQKSGGELKGKLFTGSALLAPEDHLSGVRDGIAQLAWIAGTYNPSDIPEDNVIFQMGFVYPDYFVGSFAVTEMNMLDARLQEQWQRNNLVYMGGFATPPYRLFCSKKVQSLEDLEGLKVRSTGAALPNWLEKVNAVPVNVASSESYTGLEKGQLDCATNAMDDLRSRSYWDVAKHVTMVELGVYWSINAANRDFWQSLSTEQRQVFLDSTAETLVDTGIGYLNEVSVIVDQAKAKGVAFHEPSENLQGSIDAHRQTIREFAANMGSEKFNIADSAQLLSRFEEVVQKWRKLLSDVDYNDRETLLSLLRQEVFDQLDPAAYGMQ